PGVRFGGLRTVAFDGCSSIRVPDTARNRAWPGRIRHKAGFAGYPLVHLMTLAETGTRALLGAVIGCAADGDEPALARGLLPLLGKGMLVLADRAFDTNGFLAAVAGTGAHLLVRARATRSPLVAEGACQVVCVCDLGFLAEVGGEAVGEVQGQGAERLLPVLHDSSLDEAGGGLALVPGLAFLGGAGPGAPVLPVPAGQPQPPCDRGLA